MAFFSHNLNATETTPGSVLASTLELSENFCITRSARLNVKETANFVVYSNTTDD